MIEQKTDGRRMWHYLLWETEGTRRSQLSTLWDSVIFHSPTSVQGNTGFEFCASSIWHPDLVGILIISLRRSFGILRHTFGAGGRTAEEVKRSSSGNFWLVTETARTEARRLKLQNSRVGIGRNSSVSETLAQGFRE